VSTHLLFASNVFMTAAWYGHLVVFVGFALVRLGEPPRWNYAGAFLLLLAAVAFAFLPVARGGVP